MRTLLNSLLNFIIQLQDPVNEWIHLKLHHPVDEVMKVAQNLIRNLSSFIKLLDAQHKQINLLSD